MADGGLESAFLLLEHVVPAVDDACDLRGLAQAFAAAFAPAARRSALHYRVATDEGPLCTSLHGDVYPGTDLRSGVVVHVQAVPLVAGLGGPRAQELSPAVADALAAGAARWSPRHRALWVAGAVASPPGALALWVAMDLTVPLLDVMRECEAGRIADEGCVAVVVAEVLGAFEYLHGRGVAYTQLCLSNVLVDATGRVMLRDLSLAAACSDAAVRSALDRRDLTFHSVYWLPPEKLSGGDESPAADVWSLGITAIEMATGTAPLVHLHPSRALQRIVEHEPPRLPKGGEHSEHLRDFVSCCLRKDPRQRPSATALRSHAFVAGAGRFQKALADLVSTSSACHQEHISHLVS
eukprot:m51a1_g1153 hypothetical protein (352) ;mRNA; f:302356-303649